MNVVAGFTRQSRLLTLGVALAAAVALLALARTRPADASHGQPDLVVTAHEVKYLGGPFFEPGYYLVITVRNVGHADAAPSTVHIRNGNNALLQSVAMPAKAPGQGVMIHHKLPNPGNCGYIVAQRTIIVDAFNTNEEGVYIGPDGFAGEFNNLLGVSHGYGPGPC